MIERGKVSFKRKRRLWFEVGFPKGPISEDGLQHRFFSLVLADGRVRTSADPHSPCRFALVLAHIGSLFLVREGKGTLRLRVRLGPPWMVVNSFFRWGAKARQAAVRTRR